MFYWQKNLLVLLLIAFSGFDLIFSDCGADVDRLYSGFCNNRQDLNQFENFNYRKDLERGGDFTRRDGRVIRERFDFSGRQRVNRFDRDEIRKNFSSNRRLATSTDVRMIRREITEVRSRLNEERKLRLENLNIRKDLERNTDFKRRVERVIREDETGRDLNKNRRMNLLIDRQIIRSEIREARSTSNGEQRNFERRDIGAKNRMEQTNQRRLNAERREQNANRLEILIDRTEQRRSNTERSERNTNRLNIRIDRVEQRQINPKRLERLELADQRNMHSELRETIKNHKNRMENRMKQSDQRFVDSEIRDPNSNRLEDRMEQADERRMNFERREPIANRENRIENQMERANEYRRDYERREPNENRLEFRIEQADQRRIYAETRETRTNRDNQMKRTDILSRKISILPETKNTEEKPINAIWTWSIIQFVLVGLILSKMLKNDECLNSKSFGAYIRGFLNANTEKTIKAF